MTRRLAIVGVVIALIVAAVVVITLTRTGDAPGDAAGPGRSDAPAPTTGATGGTLPAATPPAGSASRGDVMIDLRRQQLIGVRTAPVRRISVAPAVRAVGIVRYDETRQAEISTRVDGWIRELHADYTGRPIRRGEPLFTIYSPELLTAQNEYLLALRGSSQSARSEVPAVRGYSDRLVQAARERLLRWELTSEDIQALEQSGRATDTIVFRSPVEGVIVEKMAVRGMRIMAGQTLFRVADLSTVWVEADVYEQDLSFVRVGQTAAVTVDAYPGEEFRGRAAFVYPSVEEKTRTAKVRFEFDNRGGRLKPGMYATVQMAGSMRSVLTVPADALIDTGTEQLVFVAQGGGYFEPRRVKAIRRTGDEVEITEGLKEGEQVATGATFFLDSESQLRGAIRSYQPPQAPASADAPSGGPGAAAAPPREQIEIAFRAQPDPPRTGENTLEVTVKDAAGQPIADAEVAVTFFMAAMPTMNMPAMRNQAKLPPAGGGVYRGPGQVVMAGRWDVTVDVSRGGQRLGSRQFAIVAR